MTQVSRKKTTAWGWLAASAFLGGTILGFMILPEPKNSTEQELWAWLSGLAFVAVLFGGVGQLLRTAAHSATSSFGKKWDGAGKVIGLFGWSLGVPTAMTYTASKGAPDWIMTITFWALFVGAFVVGVVFLTKYLKNS